ncbi:DUF2785 domain-containing protein [Actinoplanes sp. TBRC 11911]|uniref:DUF2785 domain-containing protein n=1 Tax=Actinoplanes sp. TBRC 11911 TaxID=2729386 RepID=UPI00145F23A2|nr:DUF2785 domain-containing protein [Actinoplanes sp. TBRC 11911]NMO57135.1 DUF2785 domain-containing protein [Actinoplanes sp. TBRC 11911]
MDLEHLLDMLAAPDPVVRDEQAYTQVAALVRAGSLDDRLVEIGDAMADRFAHPEIQARAFAPLVLGLVVRRSLVDDAVVRRWWEAFASWWPAQTDVQGWDPELGWLHAVAHGADLVGAFGASTRLPAGLLLTLIAARTTAPSSYRYEQMEEDRLARAAAEVLSRPDLTVAESTGWLEVVDKLFATGGPGPVPAPVANTLAMLKATYIMADRGGAAVVAEGIAERLHFVFPAYPAAR